MRFFVSILFLLLLGAFGRSYANLISKGQVFQEDSIIQDKNVNSSVEQNIFFEELDTNSFEYFDFAFVTSDILLHTCEYRSGWINKTLNPFHNLLINPFLLDLPPPATSTL